MRTLFVDELCKEGEVGQAVLKQYTAQILELECDNEDMRAHLEGQPLATYAKGTPPHQLTLCRSSSGRVLCKLEINHALVDGSSIPILIKSLSDAYDRKTDDDHVPIYRDYISYLARTDAQRHIEFWKTYLADVEPCYFPVLNDGVRDVPALRCRKLQLSRTEHMQDFCKKQGVTLSNAIQLAWGLVLRAYTGSDEVCFGYLTSGREAPVRGIEGAIGTFINLLICRLVLTNDLQLRDVASKIQADYMSSMEHQYCSLAEVQHQLNLAGSPLFNTAFTFQNRSNIRAPIESAVAFDVIKAQDPSEFAITVNAEAWESSIVVSFTYWTDKLSEAQAINLAHTFDRALHSLVFSAGTSSAVGDLELLSSHGWEQICRWNKSLPAPVERCIHDMVDSHAATMPAPQQAVEGWDASFTFAELQRVTSLLASHLAGLGVRSGVYVPLLFEKSAWYIVAMMAVMKAGGAFIPLDPLHPKSRLSTLIDSVDADIVLCSDKYTKKASAVAKTMIAVTGTLIGSLPNSPTSFRSHIATPKTLAYIIFTSGTTGIPKGTMIEHGAFCTSAMEHSRAFYISSSSRVYQFASYTFDASIMEIFTTLIVGGCVCVPSDEDRMNNLSGSIQSTQANWLCLTPSVADTLQPENIPGVRVLIMAGESMHLKHISAWSGLCLINGYGPSETCVVATSGEKVDSNGNIVNSDPSNVGGAVGCRTWVVDPRNFHRLVPIGCVGELVVEGRTVGRGYINNKDQTSKVFIEDVAWLHHDFLLPKERMYRTGDLVRYNSDGTLTFVSRKDTQIKFNGQRIELGEIQSHIVANIPQNSQACVELVSLKRKALAVFFTHTDFALHTADSRNGNSTSDELILSPSDSTKSMAQLIHSGLKKALPSYMIPSLYFPIVKLPCTPQGKLDRRRLKTMIETLPLNEVLLYNISASSTHRHAPTSGPESQLRRVWAIVLSLAEEEISSEDNFFGLGGDSIMAMKLVSASRKEGFSLAVGDVLRHPVLSDMAQHIEVARQDTEFVLQPFSLLDRSEPLDSLLEGFAKQCDVPRSDIQDAYPCSSLQEGLITLSMKQAGAYVAQNVFRVPSHIDLEQFKDAWRKTLDSVDILRTRVVHGSDSGFVQVVLRNRPITWNVSASLSSIPKEDLQLDGGELSRYTIVQEPDSDRRYFVWSLHHALYDGWSLPMVLKRVEEFYFDGAAKAKTSSYVEFIKYLSNTDSKASEKFWIDRLSGFSPLHFPQASLTAAEQPRKSAMLVHSMDISLRSTSVTGPALIRSAWAIVLSAYAGSEEVVFGETLAGRDIPLPTIEDIVGPTFTTVPIRIRVDQRMTVNDYAQRTQLMAAEAIPHQHMGLQQIRRLNSETSIACEFQNLLVIQSGGEDLRGDFMKPQHDGVDSNFFTYPLVVECSTGKSQLQFRAYHDENVISTWEVQRLLYQLEHVLEQVNASIGSDKKVGDVQIFSPQDLELVSHWNGYEARVLDECLHETFLKVASSQPNAPAVCAWDSQLTYGEVKEYSGRIAQRLVSAGVGPGVLVPFCMDKSAWNSVVILGILISGAGFVPLDPSHPTSRHEEIIKDTKAHVLICSPGYEVRYEALDNTVLGLDGQRIISLSPCHPAAVPIRGTPSDVAYVIFTSGSTGKPKGVQIQHRAVSSSSLSYRDTLRMKPDSRVFQFASLCFDATIMEILTTLTYGGCVCVPDDDERFTDVAGALARMNITWAFFTPSVANIIDPTSVPKLQTLVVGGELLPIEIVNKWGDKVELINAYGPTEASVITSSNFEIARNRNVLNIGKAHTGGYAWITDPENSDRLAPVGCTGELVLHGPYLSLGYLNNAKKTADAFIENPEWCSAFEKGSLRLYKTGDLVRYDCNGDLLFMGRKDGQVKLHGQRLELGEIEHRLEMDDRIRHVLVVYPKTGPCKKRLVGVLTLKELTSSDVAIGSSGCQLLHGSRMKMARRLVTKIRDSLADQLPLYMVPSTWAVLERIPVLVSGKLDRKQVASWVQNLDAETHAKITGVEAQKDSVTASSFTARLLQQIWARVLNIGVEDIKSDQSFIALGGDSITAMQVMACCRKEGISVSLQHILKCKSVVHLAGLVGTGTVQEAKDENIDMLFELSPIQQLYFQTQSEYSGSSRLNQSFSLRINKRVEARPIDLAIQTIIGQHSMLRARFEKSHTGVWQQRITQDVASSYHFFEHDVAFNAIASLIANSQSSLDIQDGPLLIVDLFNTSEGGQILSMVAHHLIVDLVSWRIILGDLEELLLGKTLPVDKGLSFQSWCALQSEHSQKDRAEVLPCELTPADLAFWGMAGKVNTYADVERISFEVDEEITRAALGDCNKALRTEPIEIFLAVITHSFSRVFKQRSTPAVFNEGHGREAWSSNIDLSRTVGWFTTITPTHVEVGKSEDDIVDTVRKVKDHRRNTPGNGRPYFAYRYLTSEGRRRFSDNNMEMVFNYLGRMQQLEQPDALFQQVDCFTTEEQAKLMADVGPTASRFALFELSAAVINNKLRFTFVYNHKMQHQDDIQLWVSECKRILEESVARLSDMRPQRTLSDYPLLRIDYKALHKIITLLPSLGIFDQDAIEDIYPCAPMQEGIILSQIKDPEAYVMHTMYEIKSTNGNPLNAIKVLEAWQKVVDRHAALRTTFIDSMSKGGVFDQVVVKKVDTGAIFIQCPDSEVQDKLSSIKITDTNWRKLPRLPHQFSLCETPTGRLVVKLEVNHAVIDGGSIFAMMQDLAAAYECRLSDTPSLLYSDYIRHITRQPEEMGVTFWKKYLENVQPCTFPSLNRSPVYEKRLGSMKLEFHRFPELVALCETWKVTLSNLLQAVWALVLARYTGSEDVCYGYLASGRDAPLDGIESAVGAFINMLVFRLKIDPAKSLEQLFLQVQGDFLESLPFQHISVAQLQHDLGLEGRSLFNTAMSIQSYKATTDMEKASITFDQVASHDPSEYVVTANILTSRGQEMVVFRYWTDKISDDQARELSEVMSTLLNSFIDRPQQTLGDLRLTSGSQRQSASLAMSEPALKDMVSQCVREAVQQLVSNGALFGSTATQAASIVGSQIGPMLQSGRPLPPNWNYISDSTAVEYPSDPLDTPTTCTDDESDPMQTKNAMLGLVRPSSCTEKLRKLWSTFLDKELDQIKDNAGFFDLGGDSITAMRLAGAAREEGLVMKVADVFKNPTFADMAAKVLMADEIDSVLKNQIKRNSLVNISTAKALLSSDPYERYSLLKLRNVEAFLQERICPKIGVFRGGIADVFPVTNFQALAVTGVLLECKWMLNYFFLDGSGCVDIQRLKQAAFRVVQAFDIFRTLFINHGYQFLQVVVRKLVPEFVVYETDQDLDDFTRELQSRDKDSGPQLGEAFVQFIVLKQKSGSRHRIILRMSHAQYDGVCLGKIFMGLQAAYQSESITPSPPFANYVRDSAGGISSQHYNYWRSFLKGSEMTEILPKDSPKYRNPTGETVVLRSAMSLLPPTSESITLATIIKAAWSVVLARFTGRNNIIFGNVISGRNASVAGVEDIVGPCVNLIPVRVDFESRWAALDLLHRIQEQQVAGMPYESLGFRDIIKHCTDWPDWMHFSTIVQHQNVDPGRQFRLGDNQYTMGSLGTQENLADIVLLSTPLKNGDIEITLSYCSDSTLPEAFAENAFEQLCSLVQSFTSSPQLPISLKNDRNVGSACPSPNLYDAPKPKRLSILSTVNTIDKKLLQMLSDLLMQLWNEVLGIKPSTPKLFHIEDNFFALGGDLIALAALASLIEHEAGLRIKVEELIEYPIMVEQLALLANRQAETQIEREELVRTATNPTLWSSSNGKGGVSDEGKKKLKLWRKKRDLAKKVVKKSGRRFFNGEKAEKVAA